jgi:para-aminobenzoate synthetase component 1
MREFSVDANQSVIPARRDSHAERRHEVLAGWPGVVIELKPQPDPSEAFLRLAHLPHSVFFDSALRDPMLGRYSFIAADPFEVLSAAPDDASAWNNLAERFSCYQAPTLPDLPPFQGGLAGLFSYDWSRSLERLPWPRVDQFGIPGMLVGLYDLVVAFDHAAERAWVISQGFPERDRKSRHDRAKKRAEGIHRCLGSSNGKLVPPTQTRNLTAAEIAPQYPVGRVEGLTSNFSRDDYLRTVERAIEYIFAGDVFQVNLSQRLLHPAHDDSIQLYLRLREHNPATFSAFFDAGDFQIVSSSPERFLNVQDGLVETRPIKGTRPRGHSPAADDQIAAKLMAGEKDRAENIMIVDLLRNDLSRVCQPNSVKVRQLCGLERYTTVQHLVSVVEGHLQPQYCPLDLLKAAFPGGSVTGAPKVRAMQIIAELEPAARGPYCGALGYIGFDGSMDSSILIRTITAARGYWQFPVGGGIVAQSDPQREYEETWHKAEGILRALR